MNTRVIVVMGVSGAGKSHVGRRLAAYLGWGFADADDYHPAGNVEKMRSGTPLTDADREPWLLSLHRLVHDTAEPLVLACSALKVAYRDTIRGDLQNLKFVYLRGSFEDIRGRLSVRQGHYMPASLLQSQFDSLEEPVDALVVDCMQPAPELVTEIVNAFELDQWKDAR